MDEMEQKTQLSERLFDVSPESVSLKGHVSDTEQKNSSYKTSSSLYDMSFTDRVSNIKHVPKKISNNSGAVAEKRKEQIVDVLKVQGTATIGDIKKVVEGVSDKTLQRDLIALVREGILARSGSRRWTTYSLV